MEGAIKEKMENFLHDKELLKNLRKLVAAGRKSLVIDFDQLLKFDMDLAKTLLDSPNGFFDSADAILTEITKLPGMHLRIRGLDQTIKIRDIRAENVGKFIQIEGILTRASEVKPEVKEAVFKCLRCGEETRVLQVDEVFRQPLICANPNCSKKGPFKLLVENSEFRDWQTVRIQECFEELRGGRMPQQLDGIVRDDFVDLAVPGNHVVFTGTLNLLQEIRGPKQKKRTFRKILFINHIEVLQKGVEEAELKPEDEERIKELAKSPWLRNEIVSSIAPSIFGYEPVKEAIALQLFGCPAVELPDGTRIRGDSHVLLTGDPGVAKCVDPNSLTILGDGTITEAKNVAVNSDVVSISSNAKMSVEKIKATSSSTWPESIRLTTFEDTLTTSPVHPYFTLTDEGSITPILAKDIHLGTPIAILRKMDVNGESQEIRVKVKRTPSHNGIHPKFPRKTSVDLCKLVGYWASKGSGYWGRTSFNLEFSNSNEKIQRDYINAFKRVFGIEPHLYGRKVLIGSVEMGRWIERFMPTLLNRGSKGIKSGLKEIPELITRCSRNEIRALLAAYFDGGGYFEDNRIEASSKNLKLLRQIKLLLLRFSIRSGIRRDVHTNSHKLEIHGADVKRFYREIGPLRKQYNFNIQRKKNTNIDIVPIPPAFFRKIRRLLNLSQRDMGVSRSTYMHYEASNPETHRYPSRNILNKIVRNLRKLAGRNAEADLLIARLEMIQGSDLGWSIVKSVEKINRNIKMIDFQVNPTQTFVANGFIVHNSQILRWVSQVAPRGLYTSGAKVTGPGLTASAVRDEISGGWALEAGVLVIADGGLASIDEFDKMSQEDRGAILEGMEQETISVAKAGIVATLNSRTAILAAANPVLGRFDRYRSLAEQINIPPLILSRFDLIFIMRDEPRAELDRDMAAHILELHRVSPKIKPPKFDAETLRKLIIYARKYIHPKFEDKEVLKAIKDYYVNWRSLAEKGELPLPITPRQLESLIRLAKANARMRLSDQVTMEDAKNAMRLITLFLREAGIDPETGKVDIDVLMTGRTRSQRQKLDRVLEIIKQLEVDYEGMAPIEEVKRLAAGEGIKESFVMEMIDREKMRGHLYEPKPGVVSRAVK